MVTTRTMLFTRAEQQHAVLTWSTARQVGMSRWAYQRLIRTSECRQVLPGAHLAPGAPLTHEARIMAAVLVSGPGAVASHATALRLWRLFELDSATVADVTIPHERRHRRVAGVRLHRTRHLRDAWIDSVRAIPVTSPARALRDVAAATSPRVLRNLVIDAEQRGLVTMDDLREQCQRRATAAGGRRYRAVVRGRSRDRSDSGFEADVRAVLTAAGIEVTNGPVPVACPDGTTLYADIGVVGTAVVLECDGMGYHASRPAFSRDRHRWPLLEDAGRRIVWVTVDMLDDPAALVAQVQRRIAQDRRESKATDA